MYRDSLKATTLFGVYRCRSIVFLFYFVSFADLPLSKELNNRRQMLMAPLANHLGSPTTPSKANLLIPVVHLLHVPKWQCKTNNRLMVNRVLPSNKLRLRPTTL